MPQPWKSRIRTGAGVLAIVLSVLVIGLAALAGWLRVQLLDTDTWTETSRQTIQDPEVQDALAAWAADTIYERATPEDRISDALPERLAPLAIPASVALRRTIDDAAQKAVASDAVETAWVRANRNAHRRFVNIVDGKAPIVRETSRGLRLDLRPLLERVSEQVGLPPSIAERIPERYGTVEPKHGPEIERALKATRTLDRLAPWLPIIGVALFALGLWLLQGRRRRAIAWWGFGLLLVGLFEGSARGEVGPYLADAVTDVTTWKGAVIATWENVSWQLVLAARTVSIVGAVAMLGAWLGGTGTVASAIRARFGGWIADNVVMTWVGMVAVAGIGIRSSEALGSRSASGQLLLLALAAIGSLVLLRELSRDAVR
ncbi:MAG: hypothetical protein KDC46_09435 [Thermoleophilia bacterium]|nr:hypothetical protein [Thermoleophilia bacterium]